MRADAKVKEMEYLRHQRNLAAHKTVWVRMKHILPQAPATRSCSSYQACNREEIWCRDGVGANLERSFSPMRKLLGDERRRAGVRLNSICWRQITFGSMR